MGRVVPAAAFSFLWPLDHVDAVAVLLDAQHLEQAAMAGMVRLPIKEIKEGAFSLSFLLTLFGSRWWSFFGVSVSDFEIVRGRFEFLTNLFGVLLRIWKPLLTSGVLELAD